MVIIFMKFGEKSKSIAKILYVNIIITVLVHEYIIYLVNFKIYIYVFHH